MAKKFNVTAACNPSEHYMVNLESRLEKIRVMIERGDYFIINRSRQYGKTTILKALAWYLKDDYEVVSLDFQTMSALTFESEQAFVVAFSRIILSAVNFFPSDVEKELREISRKSEDCYSLQEFFFVLITWCRKSEKEIVLLIDGVDTASNYQVFSDFLAQLRAYYMDRYDVKTFRSVVFACLHDIRSIKRKVGPSEEYRNNST